jgi:uncharacterized DUF497 family protein
MNIIFDENKKNKTLEERGLDFERAEEIFEGIHFTEEDLRFEYNEPRFYTIGKLDGRMVVTVWTPRGEDRRIISMRKANEREITQFSRHLE